VVGPSPDAVKIKLTKSPRHAASKTPTKTEIYQTNVPDVKVADVLSGESP